jgi:hypothetical protein
MHLLAGRIDVRHQVLNCAVGIRRQMPLVAATGGKAGNGLAKVEQVLVARRGDRFGCPGRAAGRDGDRLGIRQARQSLAQPFRPPPTDTGLSQEEVGQDAQDRENQDDQDPGDTRGRFPMGPHQGPQDQGDLDGQMADHDQEAVNFGLVHGGAG